MTESWLKGELLIAMPEMGDPRFAETVIFLVEHGENGAMGLIINQPMPDITMTDVLGDLDLGDPDAMIRLPEARGRQTVLKGGPVETSRGFVLHSRDYFRDGNSLPVTDGVALTATLDALKAMAFEPVPRDALFALGYCGWGEGQLESELAQNSWLTVSPSHDLVFETPLKARYDDALALLGVTRASLSGAAGHA